MSARHQCVRSRGVLCSRRVEGFFSPPTVMERQLAVSAMASVLTYMERDFKEWVRFWQRMVLSTLARYRLEGDTDWGVVANLFDPEALEANDAPWTLRSWLPQVADWTFDVYRKLVAWRKELHHVRRSSMLVFRVEALVERRDAEVVLLSRYFQGIIFASAWMENWWRWSAAGLEDVSESDEEPVPLHEAR